MKAQFALLFLSSSLLNQMQWQGWKMRDEILLETNWITTSKAFPCLLCEAEWNEEKGRDWKYSVSHREFFSVQLFSSILGEMHNSFSAAASFSHYFVIRHLCESILWIYHIALPCRLLVEDAPVCFKAKKFTSVCMCHDFLCFLPSNIPFKVNF